MKQPDKDMSNGTEDKKDERLQSILDQIVKLSTLDTTVRGKLSDKGDELDAVVAGLNMLGEELEARLDNIKENQARINSLMELLLRYTTMDFSHKAALSEKGDEIDAIAAGLNTLGEELRFNMETLKQREEELKRSNSDLEQFAYVASHDLQEPLRMVNSYVQLLASRYKDKLDQDAHDFISFAVDGSNRMRHLINSLLEYSRINKIKPFVHINLNELVEEVLEDLAGQIKENDAQIHCGKLPEVFGDPVLLGQLFQNLVSNAIKFKGKQPPEISISGNNTDGECSFIVKDNGIGIKKEYAEKIFVIFQRLHSKDKYPGTGIGLAICKKIVERHGGKIWMVPGEEKGAAFHFTINTHPA